MTVRFNAVSAAGAPWLGAVTRVSQSHLGYKNGFGKTSAFGQQGKEIYIYTKKPSHVAVRCSVSEASVSAGMAALPAHRPRGLPALPDMGIVSISFPGQEAGAAAFHGGTDRQTYGRMLTHKPPSMRLLHFSS